MNVTMRMSALCGAAIIAACSNSTAPSTRGNDALGIADFKVTDTAERTTVVGVDSSGREVAVVDVVHGQFTMTVEESPLVGTQVNGRDLRIEIGGEQLTWQTIGYDDTSHMPPLDDPRFALIVRLVEDDHVQPILERWKIGWQDVPATRDGEVTYVAQSDNWGWANNPQWCTLGSGGQGSTGATCPIVQSPGTTPMCNGGAAWQGLTMHQGSENKVSMCCANNSTTGNWAVKTCADSGTSSSCGDIGQKCAPCYTLSYANGCSVSWVDTGYGNSGGEEYQSYHDMPGTSCYCDFYYTTADYCDTPDLHVYRGYVSDPDTCYAYENDCGRDAYDRSCITNCNVE